MSKGDRLPNTYHQVIKNQQNYIQNCNFANQTEWDANSDKSRLERNIRMYLVSTVVE